jgi:hypothetical protein
MEIKMPAIYYIVKFTFFAISLKVSENLYDNVDSLRDRNPKEPMNYMHCLEIYL